MPRDGGSRDERPRGETTLWQWLLSLARANEKPPAVKRGSPSRVSCSSANSRRIPQRRPGKMAQPETLAFPDDFARIAADRRQELARKRPTKRRTIGARLDATVGSFRRGRPKGGPARRSARLRMWVALSRSSPATQGRKNPRAGSPQGRDAGSSREGGFFARSSANRLALARSSATCSALSSGRLAIPR